MNNELFNKTKGKKKYSWNNEFSAVFEFYLWEKNRWWKR